MSIDCVSKTCGWVRAGWQQLRLDPEKPASEGAGSEIRAWHDWSRRGATYPINHATAGEKGQFKKGVGVGRREQEVCVH